MTRVLIIEDNYPNLELMNYLLTSHGYEVVSTTSGEEGLEAFESEDVDLIICDIHLPGINGVEIQNQLRACKPDSTAPIVAVTALAMVGDRDRIMSSGFDGYLAKPIDPRAFVGQIESHLPLHNRTARIVVENAFEEPGESNSSGDSHQLAFESLKEQNARYSILLLDHPGPNIAVLQQTLEPFGFGVVATSDVSMARQLLSDSPAHLVISDLTLDMEADFSLIKFMRQDPVLSSIPLLYISAGTDERYLEAKSRAHGANGLLSRPISPDRLLANIHQCLELHHGKQVGA